VDTAPARTRRPRRPWVVAVLGAAALGLLAGCGSPSALSSPSAAANPDVEPRGVSVYTGDTALPDDPACVSSWKPNGPVPAPGDPTAPATVHDIRNRVGPDRALKVGVDQTTLNWGYLQPGPDAQPQGFDVDMLVKVATAIFGGDPVRDGTIRFVVVPNADRVKAVHDGTVDILAETMTITCDRKQQIAFSTEYFTAQQKVLVPNNSPIRSLADLNGRRACATQDSTSVKKLKELPGVVPVQAATQTDCLVLLQQGQVDAISTDDTILEGLRQQDPNNLRILDESLRPEPYGLAMKRDDPEFVRFVNAVLDQDRNGGWATTYERWLCPQGPGTCTAPSPPRPSYLDG